MICRRSVFLIVCLAGFWGTHGSSEESTRFQIELLDSDGKPLSVLNSTTVFQLRVRALQAGGMVDPKFEADAVALTGVARRSPELVSWADQIDELATLDDWEEKRESILSALAAVEGLRDSLQAELSAIQQDLEAIRTPEAAELLALSTRLRALAEEDIPVTEAGPFAGGEWVLASARLLEGGSWIPSAVPIQVGADSRPDPSAHWYIPGWYTLLPSLLAILLAMAFRRVILALLAGIWVGAVLVFGLGDLTTSWLIGTMRMLDHYFVKVLTESGHIQVLMFSLALGGMVGVIARSGGMQGIVELLAKLARGPRTGQLATWFMGLFIFFDDYANSLLVGNTMRPLTDRLRISREKLAYIVDSTAAPIASVALISTWIGFELTQIADSLERANPHAHWDSAYLYFLESIPYRFYAFFAFLFVIFVALTRRDFGPMLRAEGRAFLEGKPYRDDAQPLTDDELTLLSAPEGKKPRAMGAILPILGVILATFAGLFYTGLQNLPEAIEKENYAQHVRTSLLAEDDPGALSQADFETLLGMAPAGQAHPSETEFGRLGLAWTILSGGRPEVTWTYRLRMVREIIAKSDSYAALLWAAFVGSLLAGLWALATRVLSLGQVVESWVAGLRAMIMAALILVLAWSVGAICDELGTATYVGNLASGLPAWSIPTVSFLLAAAISFATGSSWTTMIILFPIVIPLSYRIAPEATHILMGSMGSILAGSIFGDHCSPISDTTVMSSMASACDHGDHVRTQLPYALLAAGVSILFGYLPAALFPEPTWLPWALLGLGGGVLLACLMIFGKRPESLEPSETEAEEKPLERRIQSLV